MSTSTRGACLCGAVTFAIAPPYRWFAHCHCSMCRKHHGSLFGTGLGVARERLRMAERQRRHRSLPRVGGVRAAVLPPLRLHGTGGLARRALLARAGGPLGRRSRRAAAQSDLRRIEVAVARARRRAAAARGVSAGNRPTDHRRPAAPARRAGGIAGSCLCDGVAFAVAAIPRRVVNCYCSLCRRRSGAAFTSTLLAPTAQFRWLRGETRIRRYALPAPRADTRADFCADCGSPVPSAGRRPTVGHAAGRRDRQRLAAVAGVHLYVGSKAPWYTITDALAAVRGAAAARAVHGVFSVGCSSQQLLKAHQVLVALDALVLANALVGTQPERLPDRPRFREHGGIFHRRFVADRVERVARVALGDPQLFGVNRADSATTRSWSLNDVTSTTSVSPSQRATDSPRYDGSASSGGARPSVGMMRNA